MSFWNRFFGSSATASNDMPEPLIINPPTGLPMQSGYGGSDIGGSPFGIDIHQPQYIPLPPPSTTEW